MPVDYVEEPFDEVDPRGEHAVLIWPDGAKRRIPWHIFEIEHERASRAIAARKAALATEASQAVLPAEKQYRTRH